MEKRRNATPDEIREWGDKAQIMFIDALPQVAPWTCKQIAFHGGTSLNLSWNSPRFSEDLDFLLSNTQAEVMGGIMDKAVQKMRDALAISDPNLELELRNKSREGSNLAHFQLVVSHRLRLEKSMVKVEFWKVDQSYLDDYKTEFVTPARRGDIVTRASTPISAATLDSAFADKLTAFATRPHLKWRDLFDLWWLNKQAPQDLTAAASSFLHHVSAYTTVGELPPAEALRDFARRNTKESVIEKADPDLRKWLPDALWKQLNPDGIVQIVDYVFDTLDKVADDIDRHSLSPTTPGPSSK